VQGRSGITPFAAWAGRWGLWPLALAALLAIGLTRFGPRKNAERAP
jgi:apolipoprotein N-acyltransferase